MGEGDLEKLFPVKYHPIKKVIILISRLVYRYVFQTHKTPHRDSPFPRRISKVIISSTL